MRPRPRQAALILGCLLAGAIATGCTRPTVHSTGVSYTCCSDTVVSTVWHAGQQLPVTWTRTTAVPHGQHLQPVTLSAVLIGPFSKATALKAAITGHHGGKVTVASQQIRISRNPPRSVVSVIAIPASAPPGLYNLQTIESSGGGTVTGDAIVSVG